MPIYEYRCRQCGEVFEQILLSAEARIDCRNCHSSDAEQLLSTFAVPGSARAAAETGPCGTCGAPKKGMCIG